MSSSVKVDLSGIDTLKKALSQADGADLQVGWFESAKYDAGTPVAGIAAVQEFGSKSIPPRPFFRPTVDEKQDDWTKLVEQGANAMIEGNASMGQVMNALGLAVQADLKNAIAQGDHLPLSPITIALRKLKDEGYTIGGRLVGAVAGAIAEGRTGAGELGDQSHPNKDPLRDTGIMLATLTYEVSE